MSEEQALLADIIKNPDDDGPRLVYADWLSERGDDRGEFIQVQCRLAKLDEDEEHWAELKAREEELLEKHGRPWGRPMRKHVGRVEFYRGMPERVSMQASKFETVAPEIFKLSPISHAKLRDGRDIIEKVAASKHLLKIQSLSLNSNQLGMGRVVELVKSKNLKNLTWLDLGNNKIGVNGLKAVLASPNLKNLTGLGLDSCDLGDKGVELLAKSKRLSKLNWLGLNGNSITDNGIKVLSESKHLPETIHVELAGANNYGDVGFAAIINSPLGSAVRDINLASFSLYGNTRITDQSMIALKRCKRLKKLRSINLKYCHEITDEGLIALAKAPLLKHVKELKVQSLKCSVEGIRALANSNYVQNVECLEIGDYYNDHLGDAGFRPIAESKNFRSLKELYTSRFGLTHRSVAAMCKSKWLEQLTTLDLSQNDIGNKGAIAIAKAKVPNLTTLNLYRCGIENDGAAAIADSEGLVALDQLRLVGNSVGKRTAKKLKERFAEVFVD